MQLFGNRAAAQEGDYVRVVVERGIDHAEGLIYRAPRSLGALRIGDRVQAPLGRGDRPAEGYVVEIGVQPDIDPGRIKPISAQTGVRLPPRLLELARWMSRYYCCPLGMVLATMAPAAVKRGVGVVRRTMVEPTGASPDGLTPTAREAFDKLGSIPAGEYPIEPKQLAARLELRNVGPVNRLIEAGALREVEVRRVRAAFDEQPAEPPKHVEPTADQRAAIGAIEQSLGEFRSFLLRGVTGSGKTEVYLRVLERAIAGGDSAIVLVPEISLTPQTASRFLARFASAGVAVLHSGLTSAQRNAQWSAVASGDARVIIGARSAVFAPVQGRVGLIVVDEEHDDSYKQDQLPRYHARDVAIKRAQLEGCPIILGSATPSIESWANAIRGRHALLELPNRVGGGALPRVRVVDLMDERRRDPEAANHIVALGPTLRTALGRTLDAGAQAILMLNRRGWANHICCPDQRCGWVMVCSECDAAMVLHRDAGVPDGRIVRCHHCLAEQRLPGRCPTCERRVVAFGLGTQRIEEELERRFPELISGRTLLRIDSDTMRRGSDYFDALRRFREGDVRVLLGTQMLAKGHDFPGVRLVGIVNADTSINMPDFRAEERTFQLVSQVAGRAGRADLDGSVIVQTLSPQAPSIRLAAMHDYTAFASMELERRERAALPPYARMVRVVTRHEDHTKATALASQVAGALAAAGEKSLRIRGPMPCAISRVAGFHRIAVEATAPTAAAIQRAITRARNDGALLADAHTAIDVDPVALL